LTQEEIFGLFKMNCPGRLAKPLDSCGSRDAA
jgi:hypothetical protein